MLERCERRAINLSDVVIAVSQEDKEKMGLLYHRTDNVHVVPNGYNGGREYNKAGLRNLEGIPLEKRVAVFIGSQTPPNEAAAKRVLDIASQDPNTLYLLVGECSEGLKTDRKNVRLVGQVEDADKYLSMADVGLLPVLEGSGSNVKLLHYLSRGLSVVTTPFGLRGYAPLKNYVSVGQVEEFRDMIGEAGTKKVQPKLIEVYKWDNLALRLDEIIRRAVNGTN
jgi:hypothetical protein